MHFYADLPYSQACENNKGPIVEVLKQAFSTCQSVLEVGSGTGQHAVHFAESLPHLCWQATDQPLYIAALAERIRRAGLPNLPLPLPLNICANKAPLKPADGLFTANTLHIMPWPVVELFFSQLTELTQQKAVLCIYGPFNYDGQFTSASNRVFDQSLKNCDPAMGIRDIAQVLTLASTQGFVLHQDIEMPANNRLLWLTKASNPLINPAL